MPIVELLVPRCHNGPDRCVVTVVVAYYLIASLAYYLIARTGWCQFVSVVVMFVLCVRMLQLRCIYYLRLVPMKRKLSFS